MPVLDRTFLERIPFTEWANLHAHLIWVYDGPVEERWRHGAVPSSHLSAWLVRKGRIEVRVGKTVLRATAGQWLFPPCGNLWRECSEDVRILSIRFRASWPTGEELFQEGLGFVIPAAEHPELERAARPLAQFIARHFPKAYRYLMDEPATLTEHLYLQMLFSRWLNATVATLTECNLIPSRMGRIDPRVLKAARILDRRTLSAAMAERDLAREVGLSVCQMSRLFMRQFGISPHAYFDRRREEYAISALQSSPLAVKEIAYQLGFSSLPHFSAWFRRRQKMSPREFRAQRFQDNDRKRAPKPGPGRKKHRKRAV